jgi:hypothetical protein
VLTSLREELGDRFPRSPGLEKLVADGTTVVLPAKAKGLPKPVDPAIQAVFTEAAAGTPLDEAGVLDSVLTALTVEVGHMLEEGVVATPQQIDLCMILGAGWPFQMGGATPYLDRVGASERVFGDTFHHPPIRGVAGGARPSKSGL